MRNGTLLDVREYFVNTLKIYFVRRIYSKISRGNGEKMNPIGHECVNTISVRVLRPGSFRVALGVVVLNYFRTRIMSEMSEPFEPNRTIKGFITRPI